MKEVEQVVYQTMIADTGTGGLVGLLGSATRIVHQGQNVIPSAPGLTYGIYAAPKGSLPRFTREVFIAITAFATNYSDIGFRLMRLFDERQHSLSVISGGAVQIGSLSSVLDFEGPDGFDESLEVQKKDWRFRFFAGIKAQNPV